MNKLLHVRPVVIARRSVALVKQDKNELSVNVSDTKWNIVYSSGQQNHTMACRRQKLRYCLRKLAQIFPAIFIFRTFIFMGTGYEHMLLDLRDIEGFLYFGIFLSLLEYYTIPGSQINAIYVDQDAKFIRIEKVVDSSGAIQTQVVPRSKITAVKAEQVQATLPIIKGSKKIDSLALTSKATIHDPLIFELIFGPYAYNSYQYFQRGESIGLESVFVKLSKLIQKRNPRSSRIPFLIQVDAVQRDLRYQRNSIMQQKLGMVKLEPIESWK